MNRFLNNDFPVAEEMYNKCRRAMGADVIAGHVHYGNPLKVSFKIVLFWLYVRLGLTLQFSKLNNITNKLRNMQAIADVFCAVYDTNWISVFDIRF